MVVPTLIALATLSSGSITVDVHARAIHPGELVVLTIGVPMPVDNLSVEVFGAPAAAYRIDDHTWRALIGIDLSVKPGTYDVMIDAGHKALNATQPLRVLPYRFATRVLRVDDAFVNPPASLQDRIAREAQELAAIWETASRQRLWTGAFVKPVPGTAVSRFGTRSVFNGKRRAPHSGADFVSAAGTPVLAPNAGKVLLARPLYFSGNTVVIDHGLGVFSLLAHLSAIDVQENAMVESGQVVGRVGATGRVTGPHLHWAVHVNNARVDPLALLELLRN